VASTVKIRRPSACKIVTIHKTGGKLHQITKGSTEKGGSAFKSPLKYVHMHYNLNTITMQSASQSNMREQKYCSGLQLQLASVNATLIGLVAATLSKLVNAVDAGRDGRHSPCFYEIQDFHWTTLSYI
jgi:hypothetical protein